MYYDTSKTDKSWIHAFGYRARCDQYSFDLEKEKMDNNLEGKLNL